MEKIFRKFIRFVINPLSGFVLYLFIIAFFLLFPRSGSMTILFYFCLPFLFLAVLGLNIPFVSILFRRFTMSEKQKWNHALEHGTILFLRQKYGKNARIGGRAKKDGFRISGVRDKTDLVRAFKDLSEELGHEDSDLIVSMRCGSNITTAQGFGIILLTLSGVGILVFRPIPEVSFSILVLNVLMYFLLRRRLASWIQYKLFMSLNFARARIHSINKVKKEIFWEQNPVYFVKTIVE